MARRTAPRKPKKIDRIEGPCVQCRRNVIATAARVPDGILCCGSVTCSALQHWSAQEWIARAGNAARRPPWRRGQRLDVPTRGWCDCTGQVVSLVTVVVRVEDTGAALLVVTCPRCQRLFSQPWWDNPHGKPADSHRWIDFEALRRHPQTVSEYVPELDVERPAARITPAPVESVVGSTGEPKLPVAPHVPVGIRPEEMAAYRRGFERAVADGGGLGSVELAEPSTLCGCGHPVADHDPPQPHGACATCSCVDCEAERADAGSTAVRPPPGATQTRVAHSVGAHPSQLPRVLPEATSAYPEHSSSGPALCLLAEQNTDGWHSKCGRTVAARKGTRLGDAGMTGWGSQVSCPRCLGRALSAAA